MPIEEPVAVDIIQTAKKTKPTKIPPLTPMELELHLGALQRRDLNVGSQRRFREGDGNLDGQVVALLPEQLVGGDVHGDVEG